MKTITKLWIFIVILILLAPLGLMIPKIFRAGAAWGEWGPDEVRELIGYVPRGLERLSALWQAPLPDYAYKDSEGKGLAHLSIAYIVSAAIGILVTAGITILIGKFLTRNKKDHP